jgi:hypothetical protein
MFLSMLFFGNQCNDNEKQNFAMIFYSVIWGSFGGYYLHALQAVFWHSWNVYVPFLSLPFSPSWSASSYTSLIKQTFLIPLAAHPNGVLKTSKVRDMWVGMSASPHVPTCCVCISKHLQNTLLTQAVVKMMFVKWKIGTDKHALLQWKFFSVSKMRDTCIF